MKTQAGVPNRFLSIVAAAAVAAGLWACTDTKPAPPVVTAPGTPAGAVAPATPATPPVSRGAGAPPVTAVTPVVQVTPVAPPAVAVTPSVPPQPAAAPTIAAHPPANPPAKAGTNPAAYAAITNPPERQRMMDLLGIERVRRGLQSGGTTPMSSNSTEAGIDTWPAGYLEVNPVPRPPHASTLLPEVLTLSNGEKVTDAKTWWEKRRPEILEMFDREVYGRVPKDVPAVKWTVRSNVVNGNVRTKQIVGTVDNSAYPQLSVTIQVTFSTPANATGPVPVMLAFGGGSPAQCLAKGWGYGSVQQGSIQGSNLLQGIIGLTSKGKGRKVDEWGAERAWAWGVDRAIDYFETDKDVDAKCIGLEGHSFLGKATIVSMAYDQRLSIAFVSSSGEGGAKIYRRNFGEPAEGIGGTQEYYWMAGNWLKYAGPLTVDDLPVDAHEFVALCAPRPVFISAGSVGGDGWQDPKGMFLAAEGASPVYELLGKKGMSSEDGKRVTEFPPILTALIGGEVAYREHDQGHVDTPNWPTFITYATHYWKVLPAAGPAAAQ